MTWKTLFVRKHPPLYTYLCPHLAFLHDHKQEREGHHYTFMIHTDTLHDHGTSGREKQAESHGDFGGVLV